MSGGNLDSLRIDRSMKHTSASETSSWKWVAVVLAIVAVAIVVWLLFLRGGESVQSTDTGTAGKAAQATPGVGGGSGIYDNRGRFFYIGATAKF